MAIRQIGGWQIKYYSNIFSEELQTVLKSYAHTEGLYAPFSVHGPLVKHLKTWYFLFAEDLIIGEKCRPEKWMAVLLVYKIQTESNMA